MGRKAAKQSGRGAVPWLWALTVALAAEVAVLAGCAGSPVAGGGAGGVPDARDAQGLVFNAEAGTWHASVAEAFAAAGAGDALYLCGDAEETALVLDAGGISLDLQGHVLSIDARGSGARGQGLAHAALSYEGPGTLALHGGSLDIAVGALPETTQSATTPYCGIRAQGGGGVLLEGVAVDVAYAGESSVEPAASLFGVDSDGPVSLEAGTSLTVSSAPEPGAYGASTVAGVCARGTGESAAVELSADSRIDASNSSKQVVQGALGYPGAVFGSTKADNSELIELELDPELGWYDDLQEEFLAHASFDSPGDEDGYVYGAGLYYLTAKQLDGGPVVWAFSDVVDPAEAGLLRNVRASHVFVRSDYATPLDAYGIWCAAEAPQRVVQAGTVEASTTLGHAYGVYAPQGSALDMDEAGVQASCGEGAFRVKERPFDLSDYLDLTAAGGTVAYPAGSAATAVVQERPVAAAVAYEGDEPRDVVEDPATFAELFPEWDERARAAAQEPADDQEDDFDVGLTLCYYRMGREGYLYTGQSLGTFAYRADLDFKEVADTCVQVGDVVDVEGVTYRFAGWSPRTSDRQPLYVDHLYAGSNLSGFRGERVVFYGVYQPLGNPANVLESAGDVHYALVSHLPVLTLRHAATSDASPAAPSRLPGALVLGGFAALVAACGIAWAARGRVVEARVELALQGPAAAAAPEGPASGEGPASPASPGGPRAGQGVIRF